MRMGAVAFHLRSDPCGLVCLFMTYAAVLYADYVVLKWIILETFSGSPWGVVNGVAFNIIVILLLVSHFRAIFSDPGIVPLPSHPLDFSDVQRQDGGDALPRTGVTALPPPDEGWTVCTHCEMYRPPRAHHCRICRRCILRMDHHCPWINNCVGERNQKFFLQFLFYVGLLSIYSVVMVAVSWSQGFENHRELGVMTASEKLHASRDDLLLQQTRILHSIILCLESFLFGLFVFAIGCDQFEAIFSDETLVERAKKQGPYRRNKTKMALLAEVCGRGKHPFTWLLPCLDGPNKSFVESSINDVV